MGQTIALLPYCGRLLQYLLQRRLLLDFLLLAIIMHGTTNQLGHWHML